MYFDCYSSKSSDAVWANERGKYLATLKPGRKLDYARDKYVCSLFEFAMSNDAIISAPGTPLSTPHKKPTALPTHEDFDENNKPKDKNLQALEHYALLVVMPDEIDWYSCCW